MIRAAAPGALPLPAGSVWAFAALLVVWGNATTVLLGPTAALPGGSWAFAAAGAALALVSLSAARAVDLDTAALGLRGPHLRGALLGAALGGGLALAGIAALLVAAPLVVGHRVEYAPLVRVGASSLLLHVLVLLPLGVVVPEEIAFRGVLLGALARGRSARAAIVSAAAVFALWHGAVVVVTIGDTTLAPPSPWMPAGVAGALAVVAAGGVLFGWLRRRTGTLATTIFAHWIFNGAVLVGLWSTSTAGRGCC